MAFSDPRGTNWGCIAAALFLFGLGLPAFFGTGLAGPCLAPEGCIDKRIILVLIAGGSLALTLALMWGVNKWVARVRERRGR